MNRRGFTLIETVMALTVLAIVGSVAFTGVMRVADLSGDTDRAVRTALNGWHALTRVTDDIAHATTMTTPSPGGNSLSVTLTRDAASYDGCAPCIDRSLAIRYQIDPTTRNLVRIGDGVSTPLVGDVTSFAVNATTGAASARLYSVILIIASPGDRPRTFTTAVRPLRLAHHGWQKVIR